MRTIHYSLLKAMFPGLIMILGGWGLRWLILQSTPLPLTPVSGIVVWRLMGGGLLSLSSGFTMLKFYPLARDERLIKDLGRGMNQFVFLLVLPFIILLSWNEWLEMSQYLIWVGGIFEGWTGSMFVGAVIGEVIFRLSQKN